MNIETALKRADEWTDGQTFHALSEGWRPAVAVLAEEIRKLRAEKKKYQHLWQMEQRDADGCIKRRESVISRLENENERLRADQRRIDWLADVDNYRGTVSLPTACVEANVHCMRAAIDSAMALGDQAEE